MDVYAGKVGEQFYRYPVPQESGNKTDARWAAVTAGDGVGLMAVGLPVMDASVYRYEIADIEQARHPFEMKPRDYVILNLDYRHSGLGNGSCGPGTLDKYKLDPEVGFSVLLKPVSVRKDDPAEAAKTIPAAPASGDLSLLPPPATAPGNGMYPDPVRVKMEPGKKGAGVRYTLDGTPPGPDSFLYESPFLLEKSGVVRARTMGDGLNDSLISTASFTIQKSREADKATGAVPGVEYAYYEGNRRTFRNFKGMKPVRTGTAKCIDLEPRRRDGWFALVFTGYIKIPRKGTYTFHMRADDGGSLSIASEELIKFDRWHHPMQSRSITLMPGLHPLKVEFIQADGPMRPLLLYEGPGLRKTPVTGKVLYRGAKPGRR